MVTELPEQNRFPNTDSRNEIPLDYHAFHFLTERIPLDSVVEVLGKKVNAIDE